MKFGGITWWRNNYGSILQAYALQEELNRRENIDYEIINQFGRSIASADNVLDKLKTVGLKKTLLRAFWKFGMPGLRKRNQKIQHFVDTRLKVSQQQYTDKNIVDANDVYDGFFCGSDQIWNPELVSVNSLYWLYFARPEKKRIAYAPSIGINHVDEVTSRQIAEHLSHFTAVSCRECTGTTLINAILGQERCQTVLDPTMLVERAIWDELSQKPICEEPYLFAYMLRGDKRQRMLIESYAKANNLKVVTIPFLETEYTEWYDLSFGDIRIWDVGPDEFVSLIRHAKCVFTDSFHSMVFSIIYHVPFCTFPKVGKAQMNRITGLQQMMHIGIRMVDSQEEIGRVMEQKIDWQQVDAELEVHRSRSRAYLNDALSIKGEGDTDE